MNGQKDADPTNQFALTHPTSDSSPRLTPERLQPMATNVQPTGNKGMQISSHPNPKNLPLDQSGKRGWSFPLCGCFDECGTCVLTCCCPCIMYSRISTRLDHLAHNGSPHPTGGDNFSGACLGYAATAYLGVSCILVTLQRGATRERYNIAGDGVTDFLTACCCQLCDLVQRSREIELEEQSYGR